MNMQKHEYKCYIDRKETIWTRNYYVIEATSKEEATNRAKEIFLSSDIITDEFIESEPIYDTFEPTGVMELYVEDKLINSNGD